MIFFLGHRPAVHLNLMLKVVNMFIEITEKLGLAMFQPVSERSVNSFRSNNKSQIKTSHKH